MATLTVLTLLYFLPTLIAGHRGHSVGGLLVLNFLLDGLALAGSR